MQKNVKVLERDENKFNNDTDVKGDRGMRTSSTIILM
jgi:hypothetical protein